MCIFNGNVKQTVYRNSSPWFVVFLCWSTEVNKWYQISSKCNFFSLFFSFLFPVIIAETTASRCNAIWSRMFCCLTCIYPTIYTHSLVYSPHVCEDIVYGNGNVLNSHCEWNGSVAGNVIKTHWLGRLNRFGSSVIVGVNSVFCISGEKHKE